MSYRQTPAGNGIMTHHKTKVGRGHKSTSGADGSNTLVIGLNPHDWRWLLTGRGPPPSLPGSSWAPRCPRSTPVCGPCAAPSPAGLPAPGGPPCGGGSSGRAPQRGGSAGDGGLRPGLCSPDWRTARSRAQRTGETQRYPLYGDHSILWGQQDEEPDK